MRTAHLTSLLLVLLTSTALAAPVDPAERDAVIEKALTRLDRTFTLLPEATGTPQKQFVAATIGLVNLMAKRENSGRYRKYLLSYLDRVERRTAAGELPSRHGLVTTDREIQYTWALAQAAFYFAELYERGGAQAESRNALVRITRLLQDAQRENGGWGHGRIGAAPELPEELPDGTPFPKLEGVGGYPETLLASSNTVASSLGMIQLVFPRQNIQGLDRARDYYRKARLENGNFPYDPSQRSAGRDRTGISRTGGALLAMYYLGFPTEDPDLAGSLTFVTKKLKYVSEGHGSAMLNFAQSALALRLLDDRAWLEFKKEYFPRISANQNADGDITCVCEKKAFGTTCDSEDHGFPETFLATPRAYVTALNTFVLLLDTGRLDILRKRPKPVPRRDVATEAPERRRPGEEDR